jgi:hypothetical protein
MSEIISLDGPVEEVDGELVLLIPLEAGGDVLADKARGIGAVDGEFLKVTIPQWLATKLGITAGTIVNVNNKNGKFNIYPRLPTHATEPSQRSAKPGA